MKIAFIADSQLGKRLYGLRDTYLDWLTAFKRSAEIAIREKVDLVIYLGDTFDAEAMYPQEIFAAQTAIKNIQNAGIKTYGILGNHDKGQSDVHSNVVSWLTVSNITPLDYSTPIILQDTLGKFSITGINHQNKNLLARTLATIKPPANVKRHYLCMHQALKELGALVMGWEFETSQIPEWINRVFIGDFHNACQFTDVKGRIFQYPGAIETVSFNQETEPGFIIFDTELDTFEHYSTKQRDYIKIKVKELPAQWESHINTLVEASIERFKCKPIIQLICYEGIREDIRVFCEGIALKVLPMEIGDSKLLDQNSKEQGPLTKDEVTTLASKLLPKTELGDLARRLLFNPTEDCILDWQKEKYPKACVEP